MAHVGMLFSFFFFFFFYHLTLHKFVSLCFGLEDYFLDTCISCWKLSCYVNVHLLNFRLQVTSPYGNTLHHNENATIGQFAFTTTEAGNYLACFWKDSTEEVTTTSVSLDWKIGIAAKDWDSVARKEKIEVRHLITVFFFFRTAWGITYLLYWR